MRDEEDRKEVKQAFESLVSMVGIRDWKMAW